MKQEIICPYNYNQLSENKSRANSVMHIEYASYSGDFQTWLSYSDTLGSCFPISYDQRASPKFCVML
jgi:hypothetical protein